MAVTDDFVTLASCDVADLANWSAGGQAGAPTNDVNNRLEGDASINMGKTGGAAVDFYYDRDFSPAINLTNYILPFWLYLRPDIISLINVARVYLYDSTGKYQRYDIENDLMPGWTSIVMGTRYGDSYPAGYPDMSDIVRVRIYFETNNAADTIAVGLIKMDYWHYGFRFTVTAPTTDFMEDIYQHDKTNVLGIWERFYGKITTSDLKICYLMRGAEIYVDNGASVYAENRTLFIYLPHGRYPYYYTEHYPFNRHSGGLYRFGRVTDEPKHVTGFGCEIYSVGYSSGLIAAGANPVEIYSTKIRSTTFLSIAGGTKIWNSILHCPSIGTGVHDVFNIIFNESGPVAHGVAAINYGATGSFEKITAIKCGILFYLYQAKTITVKNVFARGNTYLFNALQIGHPSDPELGSSHFINVDADNWNFKTFSAPPAGWQPGKIYREYEFDVTCIDHNGAVDGVSVIGEYIDPYGEAFSVSTGIDGKIATQIVKHGFFRYDTGDIEQLMTPLKATYSKPGYQTVVKPYPLDREIVDRVRMHKAVGVFFDFGRPVINLKKSDSENKNVLVL